MSVSEHFGRYLAKNISVLVGYSSLELLSFCGLSILFLHIRNLHSALYLFAFLMFCTLFPFKIILVVILTLVVEAPLKVKRVTKTSVSESILKVTRLNS